MYYEIEHWLMMIGIFGAGMLSMLGILIGVDMHRKAQRPTMHIKGGFDPRNPINARSVLNAQYAQPEEDGWYEVKPIEWR